MCSKDRNAQTFLDPYLSPCFTLTWFYSYLLSLHCSQSLIPGMNSFLKQLNITFRRDPTNFRPRINKMDSVKDKEQKLAGNYFYLESD